MTDPASSLTADAIIAAGLGTEGGAWPVGVSREPVGGADVITTYDTGGRDPLHLGAGIRRPSVQVRVRSASYPDGWGKANAIYEALGVTYNTTYTAGRVVGFVPRGDVFFIGRDDADLFLFSINFELIRDTSS